MRRMWSRGALSRPCAGGLGWLEFSDRGHGFVGRRLADMLVEQGHAITAIARATSDTGHLESLGVSIVRGELYDADFLARRWAGCGQLHHVARPGGQRLGQAGGLLPVQRHRYQGRLPGRETGRHREGRLYQQHHSVRHSSEGRRGRRADPAPVWVSPPVRPQQVSGGAGGALARQRAACASPP